MSDSTFEKTNSLRVLMVDDEDSFRKVVKEFLITSAGFQVQDCDSGEAAIEALKNKEFDLVVLDYKMPGISGLNVLQWMHEEKNETPVIMLTGAGTETIAVEAMKLGAYDYVQKDQIDLDHLPVLINGTYERFMFRREKTRREFIEREREKNLVALQTFQDAVSALAHIVNTSLSLISMNIEEYERELLPLLNTALRERFNTAFAEMKQEYNTVSSTVKSMVNISSLLRERFADAKKSRGIVRATSPEVQSEHSFIKK